MRSKYILVVASLVILLLVSGCRDEGSKWGSRTSQDDPVVIPPPFFNSLDWPEPYSELAEGSLVISGNLECQAGYFEETPVFLYVFPAALIDPPLPEAVIPPTYEELQDILEANPKVSEWMSWGQDRISKHITEGPSMRDYDDPVKVGQCYDLYEPYFNEFNYFDLEIGNFRIDFDKVARLRPGTQLLMLYGADQVGQTTLEMNIFSVPIPYPELISEINTYSTEFAERIVGLGNALLYLLANSGDDRALDMALIAPYISLYNEAYGDGYNKFKWSEAASNFLTVAYVASDLVSDPVLKDEYVESAEIIADMYDYWCNMFWLAQIVKKDEDDDLYTIYQSGNQHIIDQLTFYDEQYVLEERGGGVITLTVMIYEGIDLFAQIEIVSDPNAPLSVTGFIGGHTIVPDDYIPYFINILAVLEIEGSWPPLYIM